ncbi:MAG: OPT family oligopeptide transporter [Candidatus Eisenbacteria bacterium]
MEFTVRAIIAGMLLGGFMCLSNLYVSLKTGWSMGVAITAVILAFAIFAGLAKLRIVRRHFGILENNIMQSTASAAGMMTGGGTVAAIPAMMMITGEVMGGWQMFVWIATIAMLGLVMSIPMKQQMINIEKLRFPSGVAAAETLRALHSTGRSAEPPAGSPGEPSGAAPSAGETNLQARYLGVGGLIGAAVALLRDLKVRWMPFNLPEKITIPYLTLQGRALVDYTLAFEGSLMMIGAGAIMGWRAGWSMVAGAIVNFGVLAPWLYAHGIIDSRLGYKYIVAWSVWFGSAMILTSGLLAFALQWRTIARAIKSVSSAFTGEKRSAEEAREVPMIWFFIGLVLLSPVVIFLEWFLFGIKIWMGVISIVLSFFIAIVATRATGETDITPTGALGKVTQITFGALDPGNATTNLMTANVTGGAGLHSADLCGVLKTGYILGANPRKQFWAQFFGVVAGSLFVVPAYRLLIPTADVLGTDKWPAPGAQTWKGVAEMLAKGFHSLHPTAQWSIVVGGVLGILIVLLERWKPTWRRWIPSATGFGLGFTTPANNTISMCIGALIAMLIARRRAEDYDKMVVPVGSGFIAGESLIGVLIAVLVVAGLMQ